MIPFPTIYKKTKTGATQQWHQEIEGSCYRTISGQVGGKLVTSDWKQCLATNEGRANERTPEEQALFECAADRKKKLDKDYHETLEKIDSGSHIIDCMLAYEYKKAMARKNPPVLDECFSQPKLDGMRCVINRHGMWTRNGKPIPSCPHIFEAIRPLFDLVENGENIVFDGELYNHELKDDFNQIMSIVKKLKPTEADLEVSKSLAQFHVYDMFLDGMLNTAIFSQRNFDLQCFHTTGISLSGNFAEFIRYVPTDVILSESHLDSLYYDEYLEAGYEGQMIRENVPYVQDRTWSLLKRKEFFDSEYELVDILEGLGNWAGKAKKAVLQLPDGREFKAGITGTMGFTSTLLVEKEKYIGKMTTVNYTNLTPDGIPRFGRVKEWARMDK